MLLEGEAVLVRVVHVALVLRQRRQRLCAARIVFPALDEQSSIYQPVHLSAPSLCRHSQ